ncbi:MAG: dipeptide epimerase [Campylobacterota bacterium]|nr:dipeptide epimerase [Campylobacterota bacterium]
MKIVKIDTEVKTIALKIPFVTALRKVKNVEFVRVSITYNNSQKSFGEAPSTMAITGESIQSILKDINSVRKSLISLKPADALTALHTFRIGSSAKAALDMALVAIIPTPYIEQDFLIKTDITISLDEDPSKMFLDAKDALESGMNILKVKLGEDISHAIEVTKMLCGLDAKLIIDANQAWSLEDSLRYIDATRDVKIELIEQPVLASLVDDLKTITEYSHVPIVADESAFTLDDIKNIINSKSADIINIKLMKCGGVSKTIEILKYVRRNNITCMLGSMLEGPISINAALHLAFAYRDVIKYVDLDSPLLYEELPDELEFDYNGCEITRKYI